jgi:hypothetical protein
VISEATVVLRVNGVSRELTVDTRVSLLDAVLTVADGEIRTVVRALSSVAGMRP